MTFTHQILPGTGRGTIRRMVEGAHFSAIAAPDDRRAPSVTPSARHLPVPGRIQA
jgi:hypothetical protein